MINFKELVEGKFDKDAVKDHIKNMSPEIFKKLYGKSKHEIKDDIKEDVEQIQEREDDEYHTPTKHHVHVTISKGKDGKKEHRKATITAKEPSHAVDTALRHYRSQGYHVHDHKYLGEQAPVAPVPDKKYIKGTPENKAYKATKKPINGHPTNVKEDVELEESASDLDKHIADFTKGIKSSASKQSTYKRDGKPISNMKHVETDHDHQKVFDHLKKMGYKKTSGYDPKPTEFDMHHNREEMTSKSDPVHHASGISAHIEKEHGGKTKVHFTHNKLKESMKTFTQLINSIQEEVEDLDETIRVYKADNTKPKTPEDRNKAAASVKAARAKKSVNSYTGKTLTGRASANVSRGEKMSHVAVKESAMSEEVELEEAFINGREYASHNLMHPDHAKMDIHQKSGNDVDFYASKTGNKMQGKVIKNDGKQVHIQAHKELGDGKLHKFKVSSSLPKQNNEEFENGELETTMKSYKDFLTSIDEALWPGTPEYKKKFPDTTRGKVGSETKTSSGTSTVTSTGVKHERDYDKAEKETTEQPTGNAAKRGRGRPAGSKSGARR